MQGGVGGGERNGIRGGEARAVEGSEDEGKGDEGLIVWVNDPESAVGFEIFPEGGEALELLGGIDTEEDEVGVKGSAVLGGVEEIGENGAEEVGVPNPE